MRHLLSLLLLLTGGALADFCWTPGSNPFEGAPKATRTHANAVLIDWGSVFSQSSACRSVDFLIKSHPRFQPSAYKLSDFTLAGKTSAVIQVDAEADYVFQVIARENKGAQHGIDYKYSQMVTSYATDHGRSTGESREKVPMNRTHEHRKPASALTRSLTTIYEDYDRTTPKPTSSAAPSAFSCLPILRKVGNFGPGSKMKQDRILINFIRYMNQRPVEIVSEFLQTKRGCKEEHKKGFLREECGDNRCCPTPWSDCEDCFSDFSTCDGRCIRREWVSDGWPDCMDGSDESGLLLGGGKGPAYQFQCVHCAGVVLSAMHLCALNGSGITAAECINDMMGQGECNVCVQDFIN